MTKSLKRAFDAASKLPPKEQDALAGAILEELAAEQRWNKLFDAFGGRARAVGGRGAGGRSH